MVQLLEPMHHSSGILTALRATRGLLSHVAAKVGNMTKMQMGAANTTVRVALDHFAWLSKVRRQRNFLGGVSGNGFF